MPNTLNGVNLTRISQMSLDALLTEAAPIRQFVTDFSSDAKPKGETVTTRFAAPVSVQDMKASKAPGSVSTVKRDITLSEYDGVVIGFDDLERTYSDIELAELYVKPAVSALMEHVTTALLAEATAANGFVNVLDVAAADFDADDMADLAEALTTAKVPKAGRGALIKPTYYSGLTKDNSIQNADAFGSAEAIRENRVPRVHGINVVEYNGDIPHNGENTQGFVGHRSALCIAARGVVPPPPGTWFGKVRNIVEPITKLPIQIREYYDGSQLVYEWHINFGVSHGIPGAAIRIIDTP